MGQQDVQSIHNEKARAEFIFKLLNDLKALEYMLENDQIERDIVRIGAEQELCLTNSEWRPANNATAILEAVNDPHFTTELAKYNLEINLDPLTLTGSCFSKMQHSLEKYLKHAEATANALDSHVVLTGILPTLTPRHLQMDYMTPSPRYYALNEELKTQRGESFKLHLRGVDELNIKNESVLYEACNTSFQMHLQIEPQDFVQSFNWAQAISGPVLAISTNSPLLFGRNLWEETRIALFTQSIDTRTLSSALKNQQARVSYGKQWASGTVVDLFKETAANFSAMLYRPIQEDSLAMVRDGKAPKLEALNLHNGTIYPWNRPCYGVGGGKAHLRIENRYIPSGPTPLDEMANFAFWVGLMKARPKACDTMENCMPFWQIKQNFIKAARYGKESTMDWMGQQIPTCQLIEQTLVPMAKAGLTKVGIDPKDIDTYLNVILARTANKTGARWIVDTYRDLQQQNSDDYAKRMLVKSIYGYQQKGTPVHLWDKAADKLDLAAPSLLKHIMSTKLFTVNQDDLAALATNVMDWNDIHHMPVVDFEDNLKGILTWTHVIHTDYAHAIDSYQLVSDIMSKNVISASPNTPILEAIKTMKHHEIGCLPVVEGPTLVGIVTIKDVIQYDPDQDAV